jgi:high frequency lysogenization protein
MSISENTLGLAGVFQAADLVQQIAKNGKSNSTDFEHSINSLLTLDAESTMEVYGGLQGVESGLRLLHKQFSGNADKDINILRYVLNILVVERKLYKRPDMMDTLRIGLEQATQQSEIFGDVTHSNVLAKFAGLYVDTLSTFNYRIQVYGEESYLQNPSNIDKIRALLLAGIRSAVLWRQKGGGRWQIIFGRGKLARQAQDYLTILEKTAGGRDYE